MNNSSKKDESSSMVDSSPVSTKMQSVILGSA